MQEKLYNNCNFIKLMGNTLHPGGLKRTKELLNIVLWAEASKIADVGCGEIAATLNLLKELNYNVIGLDNNVKNLEKAAKKTNIPLILANAEKLPFVNNYLDGIICECVFPCLQNKEKVLKEFYRVLKPKSSLIYSDIEKTIDTVKNSDEEKFKKIGFKIIKIIDATEDLKNLAAQMLWKGLDITNFDFLKKYKKEEKLIYKYYIISKVD